MKKILYSVMALAIAAMTFTACEDVPEPYPTPVPGQKPVVTYEGEGTLEKPYTVADAINYAKSFGQANSDKAVYIKGFITAITDEFTTNFGNATFEMSDSKDGGNKFTFYRGLYLGNKKYSNGKTQIKVGDEVIIYGNVVNYKGNTPEAKPSSTRSTAWTKVAVAATRLPRPRAAERSKTRSTRQEPLPTLSRSVPT